MSELVGFFALSQSKLITFHKLMFKNFYFGKKQQIRTRLVVLVCLRSQFLVCKARSCSFYQFFLRKVTQEFCGHCRISELSRRQANRTDWFAPRPWGFLDSDFDVRTGRAENCTG